jgi:hypothetical protein
VSVTTTTQTASAPGEQGGSRKGFLEPVDRISEILFGLIMVLTFTGSLSAATSGHAEVRSMLIAALGCNLAWGVIDGILYLVGCLAETGRKITLLRAVRGAPDPGEAHRIIAGALPPLLAPTLGPQQLEAMRTHLLDVPEPPRRASLSLDEWLGALGVFLLVFVSTLPVVVPFLFVGDAMRALRLSNAVAITLLFLCGYSLGRLTHFRPWLSGIGVVVLGCLLVAMTMALGG